MLRYGLGLDIGIASVGWAVLSLNSKDEPNGIVDLGVRVFDKAEQPKTGDSLAKPRRDARSQRRRIRRKAHRIERVEWLLEDKGIIKTEAFKKRYYEKGLPNIYELRYKALDTILSNDELAQILVYMAKHRGFKSNRKSEAKESEAGKLLGGIKQNETLLKENGYRTIGEMIYLDKRFKNKSYGDGDASYISARNKFGDYSNCFSRDMLVYEVKKIFEAQRDLGNDIADEALEQEYLEIMLSQRSFDQGPGNMANGLPSPYAGNLIEKMIGVCSFEKKEKRASKATYTAERFMLLQTVNHTYIEDEYGNARCFTEDEKEKIILLAYNKASVSYEDVRKIICMNEEEYFRGLNYQNSEKCEKKKFVELKFWTDLKKILSLNYEDITEHDIAKLDEIGTILTCYKSDDMRSEKLEELSIGAESIQKLLELEYSKFTHLSLKAMRKIIPYLEQGFVYNEACEMAGYDFRGDSAYKLDYKLKGEYVLETLNSITNPVVKRAVSQTIKMINAIIDAYGSPVFIRVELAREMSKNFTERSKIKKSQEDNEKKNTQAIEAIKKYGILSPKGQDIVKYKLWQEQDGYDPYTGRQISIADLFSDNSYQVDHILPYSRSFDDSYVNKVVVATKANQEKGNRTPYEWLVSGSNSFGMTWDNFRISINTHIHSMRKRQHFLKEKYGREEEKAFKERNLNDTKYITKVVLGLIREHLKFENYSDEQKKQHVFSVNGVVTGYMRKRWGLDKSRDTDRHHAQDAVVIACTTPGMINAISKYVKGRELKYSYNLELIDEETGEVFIPQNFSRDDWDAMFGKDFPYPWSYFREEIEMRMSRNPEKYLHDLYKKGYEINENYTRVHSNSDPVLKDIGICTENISPFFVSRMPSHKVTGAAHEETIFSPQIYEHEGKVIQKVALQKLKLQGGRIVSGKGEYYNPQDDRVLYDALVSQLEKFDGNGEKAFEEPFYKPKSDGSDGPIVKKVKMVFTQGVGIYTNNENGIASTGGMIRIDIYKESEKYYMIPIYTSDVVKKKLPQSAVIAKKGIANWRKMEEENFLFSLYSRDVVLIKERGGNVYLGYYYGADISSAGIKIKSDDNSGSELRKGIQSLIGIYKYEVDYLGNLKNVKSHQKRQNFEKNIR